MRAFISLIHPHQLSLPQRAMHLAVSPLLQGRAAGEACREVRSARWSHACSGIGGMRCISMEEPGLLHVCLTTIGVPILLLLPCELVANSFTA